MRSVRMNVLPAVATIGIVAALGATALPMLPVWLHKDTTSGPPAPLIASSSDIAGLPSEIVVDLKDNATDADIRDLDARYSLNLVPNSIEAQDDKLMVTSVSPASDVSALLSQLRADGRVEAAEVEQIFSIPETASVELSQPVTFENGSDSVTIEPGSSLSNVAWILSSSALDTTPGDSAYALDDNPSAWKPNDPRYSEQWNFQMIDVESAWKRARGKGVVVAVIDTGVAGGTVKRGKACRDFGGTPFVQGYDFVHKDNDAYDDHGHGTHVAGTIAESTNNSEGVAGIAFDASIMPLKVLTAEGWGTSADIADAIRYAADHGANVINMSLGSAYPSDVIHKAVQYAYKKGVTIVCAAGNSFGGPVGFPAAYKECIAVSAVGPSGNIAKYSSYGKEVALAAPGGDMVDSHDPADGILQNTIMDGKDDYFAFNGTSMASPHVAAVAALIVGQGEKDPARVKDILMKTAQPKSDKTKYGAGILSAAQATAKEAAMQAIKLRHLLAFGIGMLLFAVGGPRRRFGLRMAMFGALVVGFFGPDWFTRFVGADSVWNLIGFSAIAPVILFTLLRKGPAVKIAGMLGIGIGVCLWANWHNDTLPFTAALFGDSPFPWTMANLVAALGVGLASAAKAFRATNIR